MINLRTLAVAACEEQQDQEAREEAERQTRRREAHIEHVRTQAQEILQLPEAPVVHWCGIACAEGAHPDFRTPVVEIDGLHFTCDESETSLRLITFQDRKGSYGYGWKHFRSLPELGRLLLSLDKMPLVQGHLVGSTLYPVGLGGEQGGIS